MRTYKLWCQSEQGRCSDWIWVEKIWSSSGRVRHCSRCWSTAGRNGTWAHCNLEEEEEEQQEEEAQCPQRMPLRSPTRPPPTRVQSKRRPEATTSSASDKGEKQNMSEYEEFQLWKEFRAMRAASSSSSGR